ncbi:hypothetical protein Leryth_019889 [Lithospermum erythrorhizon]|nr:hypothetical protein Leryth_019889 [Lithospermum erythrorhizon]
MRPRWKGKEAEAKALANPLSKIVSELKDSLIRSDSIGLLSDGSVLLEADVEQSDLLNRACLSTVRIAAEKDKQWFQLCLEEAFYMCCLLRCIKIVCDGDVVKSDDELWNHMTSKRENFPNLMKAYSHLRSKNWVVRSGSQYGVDYVAYRHHPALVHSDYAVLVLSSEDCNRDGRLRVWSDFHCTLRLCGSVAKTLLVLYVNDGGHRAISPACLNKIGVEERTITRWIPEHCRENKTG